MDITLADRVMPHRSKAKTRAIRPTAMILFLMTFLRSAASSAAVDGDVKISCSELSSNSSLVHTISMANSISETAKNMSALYNTRKNGVSNIKAHSSLRRREDSK